MPRTRTPHKAIVQHADNDAFRGIKGEGEGRTSACCAILTLRLGEVLCFEVREAAAVTRLACQRLSGQLFTALYVLSIRYFVLQRDTVVICLEFLLTNS
jgi:hypothetical protein